jgi:hypothetical protein
VFTEGQRVCGTLGAKGSDRVSGLDAHLGAETGATRCQSSSSTLHIHECARALDDFAKSFVRVGDHDRGPTN